MDSSRIIGIKQTKIYLGISSTNDENAPESIGRVLYFQDGEKREGVGVLISSKHIITPINNVVSMQTKSLSQKDSFVFQTSRGEYIGITEIFLEKAFLYDEWTVQSIIDQQNCGYAVLQLEKSVESLRTVGLMSVMDFNNFFNSQQSPSSNPTVLYAAVSGNKGVAQVEKDHCTQIKNGLQFLAPTSLSATSSSAQQTPVFIRETTNLGGYCLIGFAKPLASQNDAKSFDLATITKDNFDAIHRWLNGNNSSFTIELENTVDNGNRNLKSKELKDTKCEFAHSARIVSLFKLEKFYVASCSEDKQIKVWNYRTGKLKKIFKTDRACKIVFGIDSFLIGVEGNMLITIDWKNKRVENISNHACEIVQVVEVNSNNSQKSLLLLDIENTLSLYRFENNTFYKVNSLLTWQPEHEDVLKQLVVCSEQQVLLISERTGTVILFNWKAGSVIKQSSLNETIRCATINPANRSQLIISRKSGNLELFDYERAEIVEVISTFDQTYPAITIDRQSASTIVLSDGKDYSLINCSPGCGYYMQRIATNHTQQVCLVSHLDEEFFMTADISGRLRIWQLELNAVSGNCNNILPQMQPLKQFNVLDCSELREDGGGYDDDDVDVLSHQQLEQPKQLFETSTFYKEERHKPDIQVSIHSQKQQQQHVLQKCKHNCEETDELESPQFTPSCASSAHSQQLSHQKLKIKQIITPLKLDEVFKMQRSELQQEKNQYHQTTEYQYNSQLHSNSFGNEQVLATAVNNNNTTSFESEFSLVEKQQNKNNMVFDSFRQDFSNQEAATLLCNQNNQLGNIALEMNKLQQKYENLHVDYVSLQQKYVLECEKNKQEKQSNKEIIAELDKSAHLINKQSDQIGVLSSEVSQWKNKAQSLSAELLKQKELTAQLESDLKIQKDLTQAISSELDKQSKQSLHDNEIIQQLQQEVASFLQLKDQLGEIKQMQIKLAQQNAEWNERDGTEEVDQKQQQTQMTFLQKEQIEELRKENTRLEKASAQLEATNANYLLEQTQLKKENDRVKAELRRTKDSLEHWVRQYNVLLQREEVHIKSSEQKEELVAYLRKEISKSNASSTITSQQIGFADSRQQCKDLITGDKMSVIPLSACENIKPKLELSALCMGTSPTNQIAAKTPSSVSTKLELLQSSTPSKPPPSQSRLYSTLSKDTLNLTTTNSTNITNEPISNNSELNSSSSNKELRRSKSPQSSNHQNTNNKSMSPNLLSSQSQTRGRVSSPIEEELRNIMLRNSSLKSNVQAQQLLLKNERRVDTQPIQSYSSTSNDYSYSSLSPCNRISTSTVPFLTPVCQHKNLKNQESLLIKPHMRHYSTNEPTRQSSTSVISQNTNHINKYVKEEPENHHVASSIPSQNQVPFSLYQQISQQFPSTSSPLMKNLSNNFQFSRQVDITPTRLLQQPLSQQAKSQLGMQSQIPNQTQLTMAKEKYPRSPQTCYSDSKSPSSTHKPLGSSLAVKQAVCKGNISQPTTPVNSTEMHKNPSHFEFTTSHQLNFASMNAHKSQQSLDFSPVMRSQNFLQDGGYRSGSHAPIHSSNLQKRRN